MPLINVRQEKVNFMILRLHYLNKCWQVSKGKIKLYIYELRCIFFLYFSKPSVLFFESRTIWTHSESLVYTMEHNLLRSIALLKF